MRGNWNLPRGLICAPDSLELVDEKGKQIWSQDAYKFLEDAQAPDTANPSLWRNTLIPSSISSNPDPAFTAALADGARRNGPLHMRRVHAFADQYPNGINALKV